MSMFQVTGQVLHVFDAPPQVDKDSGQLTPGKHKVQILGQVPLLNGESRHDMITLSCESRAEFESLKGKQVSVPIGMFSPAKGSVVYFIPKGGRPSLVASVSTDPRHA